MMTRPNTVNHRGFPSVVDRAYELAERVELGDHLPHHQGDLDEYHAVRAALRRRRLQPSFFGVVIELETFS